MYIKIIQLFYLRNLSSYAQSVHEYYHYRRTSGRRDQDQEVHQEGIILQQLLEETEGSERESIRLELCQSMM